LPRSAAFERVEKSVWFINMSAGKRRTPQGLAGIAARSVLRSGVRHPVVKVIALGEQVVKPLVDLVQDVRARAPDVLVAQLDDHLGEAGDRPHRVDGVVFA